MQLANYGITMGYWGTPLTAQAVKDMVDLTSGHPERIMLRYQAPMGRVVANWSIYDTVVQQCNAAGIPLCLVCKRFDGASVNGPAPLKDMSAFAVQIATRYKGKLAVIEIGNEDYVDTDFSLLADTMIDVFPKLKAIDPNVAVLPGSTLHRNEQTIRARVTRLLQKAGKFIDGVTVHTYFGEPGGANISHLPDDGSVGNVPSLIQYIQAVQDVCKTCGFPNMGIYDTEWGFASTSQNHGNVKIFSEADQAKWLLYCLTEGKKAGLKHMSWFTLAVHTPPDGMSLRLDNHLTLAYQAYKGFITQYPSWGNSVPDPPLPPDPPPDPTPPSTALTQGLLLLQESLAKQQEAVALFQSLVPPVS